MNLRTHEEADGELVEAAEWHEKQRQGLGDDFRAEMYASFEFIAESPLHYPHVETLRTKRNIRRRVMDRFSYVVIYEILSDEVFVLAVAHSSRRPNYWARRKA